MATREFITGLLELYRNNPCLWKTSSSEYTNKYLKKKGYEKLVAYSKTFYKKADKIFVQQKLQNLRTVFRKELRKMEDSKRSGAVGDDIYVPKLWYYDLLLFTCDDILPCSRLDSTKRHVPNDSTGDTDVESEKEIEEQENFVKDETENSEDGDNQNSQYSEKQISVTPVAGTSTSKQIFYSPTITGKSSLDKIKMMRKKEEQFLETCSTLGKITTKREIDEFDALGIAWTSKLRKLSDGQRVLAEDLINQVLKKAYFQELTRTTVVQELHSSVPSI